MTPAKTGVLVHASAGLGVLHQLTGVIAAHLGDILSIAILEQNDTDSHVYFEIVSPALGPMLAELAELEVVKNVEIVKSMDRIYGETDHHHGRWGSGRAGCDWRDF